MATVTHVRAVGLILQQNAVALYADVLPLYTMVSDWELTADDSALPGEAEVKTVLESYEQITKLPVRLDDALRDIRSSTGDFSGLFSIPATVFPLTFVVAGPVTPGEFESQGYGLNLEIQKFSVFCKKTGTGGDALEVDLQLSGSSIFSVPPSIPANSGDNVLLVVPNTSITTTLIEANDILTAMIVTHPNQCENVTLTVWVKPV